MSAISPSLCASTNALCLFVCTDGLRPISSMWVQLECIASEDCVLEESAVFTSTIRTSKVCYVCM